jgi:hypothetical protein
MTELEWSESTDPWKMLDFLKGRASDRKSRLFAVACCRGVWPLLKPKLTRRVVTVAERYAEGKASRSELRSAFWALSERTEPAAKAARWAAAEDAGEAARLTREWVRVLVASARGGEDGRRQADLLRDLIGNPFRSVTLAPSWLDWHDGLVVLMARRMYDSRDFADMPVLADALEEAGCADADILGHCRSGGEHVRGCWVVDLLLGKEQIMTEQEWLACTDPQAMMEFLRGKAGERKARLFAVACCRGLWHRMAGPLRRVVEVGERYADGLSSPDEADRAAGLAIGQGGEGDPLSMAAWNTVALCSEPDDPFHIASDTATQANLVRDGRSAQCHLLRCIFGHLPFHPATFDPAILTWHAGLLVSMAWRMYDSRDFAEMPVLADALEEAGCQDADILGHCRSGGEHVRGCWAIDLLLGKS